MVRAVAARETAKTVVAVRVGAMERAVAVAD